MCVSGESLTDDLMDVTSLCVCSGESLTDDLMDVTSLCVFSGESLTDDLMDTFIQSLQQKDSRIVELERRIHELVTSLDLTETRCR